MTAPVYDEKLVELAHRAARCGMFIDIDDPAPHMGEYAGPFVLRHASFDDGDGYDCHVAGVNLEALAEQIDQIHAEFTLANWMRDWIAAGVPTGELKERALRAMRPEWRAELEARFNLPGILDAAQEHVS